jgi:hypothetical protein
VVSFLQLFRLKVLYAHLISLVRSTYPAYVDLLGIITLVISGKEYTLRV